MEAKSLFKNKRKFIFKKDIKIEAFQTMESGFAFTSYLVNMTT